MGEIKTLFSMRSALSEPSLFGSQLGGSSWAPWRALLIAICGEPLTESELTDFKQLTGRAGAPVEPIKEFYAVMGRRSGKTRAASIFAAYLASCRDYRAILAPRERGQIQVVSASLDQAALILDFIEGAFEASEALRPLVVSRNASTIELRSGIDIVVRPASYRTTRGATCVAVVADEAAFYRIEGSANPDTEILRALRPSLLTTKGPLIVISSPYARRGELWKNYSRHFGKEGPILVAQAPTLVMNSTVDRAWIEEQFESDPISAAAEFGAQFRTDVEAFVSLEAVEACTSPGVFERPPLSDISYVAFVDPSGGSADSMTLAIAHREDEVAVLDCVREIKPPFSPESVVAEFVTLLKTYRVASVRGDRYACEWPREQFRKHGIDYLPSDKNKSELYGALLPLLNSRRIDLLDDKRLISKLLGLERRTARGGRDSIDHAPGSHDDLVNAAAGALGLCGHSEPAILMYYRALAEASEGERVFDVGPFPQEPVGRVPVSSADLFR
jgi:hypothetical protein